MTYPRPAVIEYEQEHENVYELSDIDVNSIYPMFDVGYLEHELEEIREQIMRIVANRFEYTITTHGTSVNDANFDNLEDLPF